ncbi:MAG: aminotransferase class I/II-fold pyridoxal phosphate-dependent enzyme, partial [Bacteroidetes bacterium]
EQPYLQLKHQLEQKRNHLRQLLASTPLRPIPSHGSYFELYSYASASNLPEADMALRLVQEGGVAAIPTSAFYTHKTDHQTLRFCFAKQESTLEAAAKKLQSFAW